MRWSVTISETGGHLRRNAHNVTHDDDRLPNKAYFWEINIGDEAVCWTDDFVVEHGNVVNAEVGGRPIVVAWEPRYESLGTDTMTQASR